MQILNFTKMHGLGNDFMVVDATAQAFDPARAPIAAWADRHTGIGFDQLLLVERPAAADADFRYRIFNADGSEVEQCGNGARCFARFVHEKGLSDKPVLQVETAKGRIVLKRAGDGGVTVDMGRPRFAAPDIPFLPAAGEASEALTYCVPLESGQAVLSCVNMGNPHAVLVVDDVETAPVADWGARLERHGQFPERVNVGFMQVVDDSRIRLRVFERGVGETRACGTGACAAAVAGIRLGVLRREADILVGLPGGELRIQWADNGHVLMTGPAQTVFEGVVRY